METCLTSLTTPPYKDGRMINPDPLARRVPGEGKRANAALRDYAAMGAARSLRALLERYVQRATSLGATRPPTVLWRTICSWSQRQNWVARVDAYDSDIQQQSRLAQIAAVADMNERHVNLARAMMGIVARRLLTLQPEDLSPADTVRWAEALSKLERLARGEATERVDVFQRVRELAREMGYTDEETREAVAAAERIVRGGI